MMEAVQPMRDIKTHSSMVKIMAKILSEDVESDGILALSRRTYDKLEVPEDVKQQQFRDDLNEQDFLSGEEMSDNDGDDEMINKPEEAASRDVVKECHILPQERYTEKEKELQRIATNGVVQLFNAVSKHQKEVEAKLKEAGNSERKKIKVVSAVGKKDFIDHLKMSSRKLATKDSASDSAVSEPTWNVLREDFMKGSQLKDWDKIEQKMSEIDSDDTE